MKQCCKFDAGPHVPHFWMDWLKYYFNVLWIQVPQCWWNWLKYYIGVLWIQVNHCMTSLVECYPRRICKWWAITKSHLVIWRPYSSHLPSNLRKPLSKVRISVMLFVNRFLKLLAAENIYSSKLWLTIKLVHVSTDDHCTQQTIFVLNYLTKCYWHILKVVFLRLRISCATVYNVDDYTSQIPFQYYWNF